MTENSPLFVAKFANNTLLPAFSASIGDFSAYFSVAHEPYRDLISEQLAERIKMTENPPLFVGKFANNTLLPAFPASIGDFSAYFSVAHEPYRDLVSEQLAERIKMTENSPLIVGKFASNTLFATFPASIGGLSAYFSLAPESCRDLVHAQNLQT